MTGLNTYHGNTTISGGVLGINFEGAANGAAGSLGITPSTVAGSTGNIILNGGTLETLLVGVNNISPNVNRGIFLGASGGTLSGAVITSRLTVGNLVKDLTTGTPGSLTISGGEIVLSNANNSFTGGTTLLANAALVPASSSFGTAGGPTNAVPSAPAGFPPDLAGG